jgi:hypothetical protein
MVIKIWKRLRSNIKSMRGLGEPLDSNNVMLGPSGLLPTVTKEGKRPHNATWPDRLKKSNDLCYIVQAAEIIEDGKEILCSY